MQLGDYLDTKPGRLVLHTMVIGGLLIAAISFKDQPMVAILLDSIQYLFRAVNLTFKAIIKLANQGGEKTQYLFGGAIVGSLLAALSESKKVDWAIVIIAGLLFAISLAPTVGVG
jgi:hypothetical protein